MKLLLLFKTTPESETYKTPSSFGVQGELLARGLQELGVEFQIVDRRKEAEKEQAYREFKPDFVIGIGFWGDVPEIVTHPLNYGQKPVPWLVSDGVLLKYQEQLRQLPLILASSKYVKATFVRDGLNEEKIQVVYQGVDTDVFKPLGAGSPMISIWRNRLGIDNNLMLLTVGGDGKSKGFQEVINGLKLIEEDFNNWRYVLKVADSETGKRQTREDLALAESLGLKDKVHFFSERLSEEDLASLMNASDIYLSPSRNEGFCRPLVEAQACGVPVITVEGTTTKEVVKNGYSGYSVGVEENIVVNELDWQGEHFVFDQPKVIGVIASAKEIAKRLLILKDQHVREKMGVQARKFAESNFDYRESAQNLLKSLKAV